MCKEKILSCFGLKMESCLDWFSLGCFFCLVFVEVDMFQLLCIEEKNLDWTGFMLRFKFLFSGCDSFEQNISFC